MRGGEEWDYEKGLVVFAEGKFHKHCFTCKYYVIFENLCMKLRRDWSEDCVTCSERQIQEQSILCQILKPKILCRWWSACSVKR